MVVELDVFPALATVDGEARILAWLGPRMLGLGFGLGFGSFGSGSGLGSGLARGVKPASSPVYLASFIASEPTKYLGAGLVGGGAAGTAGAGVGPMDVEG